MLPFSTLMSEFPLSATTPLMPDVFTNSNTMQGIKVCKVAVVIPAYAQCLQQGKVAISDSQLLRSVCQCQVMQVGTFCKSVFIYSCHACRNAQCRQSVTTLISSVGYGCQFARQSKLRNVSASCKSGFSDCNKTVWKDYPLQTVTLIVYTTNYYSGICC